MGKEEAKAAHTGNKTKTRSSSEKPVATVAMRPSPVTGEKRKKAASVSPPVARKVPETTAQTRKTLAQKPAYPLFYRNVSMLNKDQHGQLRMESNKGYLYAKNTNSVYLTTAEFVSAASEYPIVFAHAQGGEDADIFPVALLGIAQNENLYIDAQGQWQADYVPAYVRRYPFILAATEENSDHFTVCIDESYSGFNTSGKGEALFDEQGKETKTLRDNMDFLQSFQGHVNLTVRFCATLRRLGLLEGMQATIRLKNGKEHALSGFMGVNREKLHALKDQQLGELLRNDMLEPIIAHVISMKNIARLRDRMD